MQIVSGKYRHRKLQTNSGLTTRPITARVKVALFDRLQPELQDSRVADIFAGTGTLGFEALSRGARSVVFVENDHKAYELLRENVATLKAEAETICWRADAAKCSFRPKGTDAFLPFDVVFFDPPYSQTVRMRTHTLLYRSLERLARDQITAPSALLVLRCERDTLFDVPPAWVAERLLEFASMHVHLFRKTAPTASVSVASVSTAATEQPDAAVPEHGVDPDHSPELR